VIKISALCLGAALTLGSVATASAASAASALPLPSTAGAGSASAGASCPPSAFPLGYSDSLDKLVYHGTEIGGLSSLAYDATAHAWVSAVDNNGNDPERIWSFRDLADPQVVRDPLVLKQPDGTPYNGTNSDNEGLAVLPNGDYLVSSETEPSIRIYDRAGVQQASLPIPARFAVTGTTPAGQATSNATLEGLTITPSGREIIAAMEGALSGDVSSSNDATLHRFLVYQADTSGQWKLVKQIAYRTDPGMRVPEVAAYGDDSFLVEEASYSAATGNAVNLYAVTGLSRTRDVSNVSNLSEAPAQDITTKKLVTKLVDCPSLGATAKQTQTNPLLDNYEGMAITGHPGPGLTGVSLISDDNFSANQTTRVLNLAARLP